MSIAQRFKTPSFRAVSRLGAVALMASAPLLAHGEPNIRFGQDGSDLSYTRIAADSDEFSSLNGSKWTRHQMHNGDHTVGNQGIDRNGNIVNNSAKGKRWSAWYDNHHSRTTAIQGGNLVMGGYFSNEADPTRTQYTENGVDIKFNEHKLYTGYLVSQDRRWNSSAGREVIDANPRKSWGPGHFFEMRVSFQEMKTRGFRLSWWLMPTTYGTNAYNGNPTNGAEIDIFEYEKGRQPNTMLMKVISSNSSSGNTPNGNVNASRFNIQNGYHTVGLLWTQNKLVWYIDGEEVQRDTARVPQVPHYMIISREMNSGITAGRAEPPFIPRDDGLWGENVWHDRAKINSDKARIDYMRVYRVNGTQASSSSNNNTSTSSSSSTTSTSSNGVCTTVGANFSQALNNYKQYCSLPRRDCDPVRGQWYCSSANVNSNPQVTAGPGISSTTSTQSSSTAQSNSGNQSSSGGVCTVVGNNFGAARRSYEAHCSLPRKDCDPVGGKWYCSSSNINGLPPVTAGN